MWHALRAELVYSRPYLIGGLAVAAGVVVILTVVFSLVGTDGPPSFAATGMRGMFMIMAPLIVGFIIQATRSEEKRARLLLMGPLTPRQLGGVAVLLPVVLLGIGVVAAGLVFAVGAVIVGSFELEALNIAGFVGGQLFAYTQIGLLAQEAIAAHRQRRSRAVAIAWLTFIAAVLMLGALYLALAWQVVTWSHLVLGHLIVAAGVMLATVALIGGRTDFTH